MVYSRNVLSVASIAATLAVAGCQMAGPPPRASAPSQTGVEGEWLDSEGVAVSRFSDGSFQTVAIDTGNTLSEGSYRYRDQRTVEISGQSVMRQSPVSYNCALVSAEQLNCTSSDDRQFVLTRRGADVS